MALGFIQSLTEINTRKVFWGVERDRSVRWQPHRHLGTNCLYFVEFSTVHTPVDFHSLLQGWFNFFIFLLFILFYDFCLLSLSAPQLPCLPWAVYFTRINIKKNRIFHFCTYSCVWEYRRQPTAVYLQPITHRGLSRVQGSPSLLTLIAVLSILWAVWPDILQHKIQTTWPGSESKLCRSSDRRVSEKLVPTFADK
jgi:hypothetical protein